MGNWVEVPEFLSGYGLYDPLEETIGEVEKGLARRDGEPEYIKGNNGVGRKCVSTRPGANDRGSASVPVGSLIEKGAVLGLKERHGQIGYVALAGVFGEVAVC